MGELLKTDAFDAPACHGWRACLIARMQGARARVFAWILARRFACGSAWVLALLLMCPSITTNGYAEPLNTKTQNTKIRLDIPSQPLADALVAFGSSANLEVFYDGALAVGRRSTAISGEFAPIDALNLLLRSTGYVPRAAPDGGGVTIVPDIRKADAALPGRYEAYFAVLQRSLMAGLCGIDPVVTGQRFVVNFWLDPSGSVSQADVFGLSQYPSSRDRISAALRKVRVKEPPPVDLPQPVTLAVYPPGVGEATGCVGTPR